MYLPFISNFSQNFFVDFAAFNEQNDGKSAFFFFSFLFRPRGFGEFDANVPSNLVEIWLHKLRSTLGILPLLDSLDPYHASIEKPDCLAIPSAMGQNLF